MSILRVLHYELSGFLFALAIVVAFQIITRRINLAGVLSQKDPDNPNQTSPERVQLLLTTIAASATYLGEVAKNTDSTMMPDVSNQWLYLLGGSSTIYMLRKAWTSWNIKQRS